MADQQKTEWGRHLKRLAQMSGFTAETLAERLGCSASAVWAWWSGRNEPAVEMLKAYARAVNVSVDYLVSAESIPPAIPSLQEWRLRFADLIRQGVPPAEAIDRISAPEPESVLLPEEEMTAEERAILTGSAAAMQQLLEDHSEGRWDELTEDQRYAVLLVTS